MAKKVKDLSKSHSIEEAKELHVFKVSKRIFHQQKPLVVELSNKSVVQFFNKASMIVTITMNPAVNKSSVGEKLIPEKRLRCSNLLAEAGRGGINVSKVIKKLCGESLAVFPAGGDNGELLKRILTKEKISYKSIPVSAETRDCFTVTDHSTNAQYRFVMPGAALMNKEISTLS